MKRSLALFAALIIIALLCGSFFLIVNSFNFVIQYKSVIAYTPLNQVAANAGRVCMDSIIFQFFGRNTRTRMYQHKAEVFRQTACRYFHNKITI